MKEEIAKAIVKQLISLGFITFEPFKTDEIKEHLFKTIIDVLELFNVE